MVEKPRKTAKKPRASSKNTRKNAPSKKCEKTESQDHFEMTWVGLEEIKPRISGDTRVLTAESRLRLAESGAEFELIRSSLWPST